jgi:hypothetical protein
MKFLILQLPPFPRHLIPLRSKYSSQNPGHCETPWPYSLFTLVKHKILQVPHSSLLATTTFKECLLNCEPRSSVSIVSGYWLDDRTVEVRSPTEAKDFSSSLCPDRLWGPPSLLYNGYRESFPRG